MSDLVRNPEDRFSRDAAQTFFVNHLQYIKALLTGLNGQRKNNRSEYVSINQKNSADTKSVINMDEKALGNHPGSVTIKLWNLSYNLAPDIDKATKIAEKLPLIPFMVIRLWCHKNLSGDILTIIQGCEVFI